MGRTQSIPAHVAVRQGSATVRPELRRAAGRLLAVLLLVLTAPIMAALAAVVWLTSHGPVLTRERLVDRHGAEHHRLRFRTVLDGGATVAHEQVRAVLGRAAELPLTGPGPWLRRWRLDRLPHLLDVAAGQARLFD